MPKRTKKIKRGIGLFFLLFVLFVFLNNTTSFSTAPKADPSLIAHRSLGQNFSRVGLTGTTCTAFQMISSEHTYLENTLPAMKAAFAYGADLIEFDVQWTTDGRFAVFHDWTLDCRTESKGRTRDQSLDSLQKLDIGYGYTADSGKTWPFRGKGIGMMPSLTEVLTTFPDKDFIIDIKGNETAEGVLLAEKLLELEKNRSGEIKIYGGPKAVREVLAKLPDTQSITVPRLKRCLTQYFLMGWSGQVPSVCKNCMIMVPANVAPWLWGWPTKFVARMEEVGSSVILIGDYQGEGFSRGFDDPKRASQIPTHYAGGIWTDRIDLIGPAIEARP